MTDPTTTERFAPLKLSIRSTCAKLQGAYLSDRDDASAASARATLAQLRKNAAPSLADNPLALQEVLFVLDPPLHPDALGKGDKPSPSENMAFMAMTLFGIHMQSATTPAHDGRVSFASACGKLHAFNLSASIKPRIDAMLLATHEASRLYHIRSLVTFMRHHHIAFDYGGLAEDLRRLGDPHKRSGVQLRWGRDFAYGSFVSSDSPSE